MTQTWKDDMHEIDFKLLKNSIDAFDKIHELLNNIYSTEIGEEDFNDLFTDENQIELKTNCTSLLRMLCGNKSPFAW